MKFILDKWQRLIIVCFVVLLVSIHINLFSQINSAVRYEIDAKRIGVELNDKDALPRSREFIRLDSTYYVGWMYEGFYKFERSSDYLGYKYAISPLYKAFRLINKDYRKPLKKIYASFMDFTISQEKYNDLLRISFALLQCYNTLEMPDSSISVLETIERYRFQKDFIGIYNEKAWLYHRSRFLTSKEHDFLGNTVEENEKIAFNYCYKQLKAIKKNRELNDIWFGPQQSEGDKLSVYHYLALLHNYNQNYDSAEYYYNKLVEGGRVSWGNYANLKHEIASFDKAIDFYKKPYNSREHTLKESVYYLPTLYIYGGKTRQAIEETQKQILRNGSTPGFGWYSIALARSYLYDAQLDSAELYLSKAENFRELHINTTLTQSQYEFTINLLKVQLLDKKISAIKFLNTGWWYSPRDWLGLIQLKIDKLLTEYVLVNQLANNPERKRIVYDLFCGESTVSFDETMYLIVDFSDSFFINKFNESIQIDKRKMTHRYFKLALMRLNLDDNPTSTIAAGNNLLTESSIATEIDSNRIDTSTEKLLLARIYEALAAANYSEKILSDYDSYISKFYEEFPQLVPFSGFKIPMKLRIEGYTDETITLVIENLKKCNIDFQASTEKHPLEANIKFKKKGRMYEAMVSVNSGNNGKRIVNQHFFFKTANGAGQELAMRLFGKGGHGVIE